MQMNEQIQQRHLPSINNRGLAVGLSHKLYELLLKISFSMEKITFFYEFLLPDLCMNLLYLYRYFL